MPPVFSKSVYDAPTDFELPPHVSTALRKVLDVLSTLDLHALILWRKDGNDKHTLYGNGLAQEFQEKKGVRIGFPVALKSTPTLSRLIRNPRMVGLRSITTTTPACAPETSLQKLPTGFPPIFLSSQTAFQRLIHRRKRTRCRSSRLISASVRRRRRTAGASAGQRVPFCYFPETTSSWSRHLVPPEETGLLELPCIRLFLWRHSRRRA